MKKWIITLILVLLVVVSLVQAFQINSMEGKVAVSSSGALTASAPSSGGDVALPTNLQNFPDLGGGC